MDTDTINLRLPPEPFMKSSKALNFIDNNFVWIAIALSIAAHFGTLAILQRDNVAVPKVEVKKTVAKVRIFANPGGNPNTQTKVVEVAKPKPQPQVKPKPTPNRKVISTAPVDQKPTEAPPVENSGPQSFGDDTTGGVVGEGFSTTTGDDYDKGITSNWEPSTRVEPDIPQEALEKGIGGYVLLSLDINEQGVPENLEVIKADPRNMFEKEAKKAVRKWRYKPRMVNGQAVKVIGHQVRVEFKITG